MKMYILDGKTPKGVTIEEFKKLDNPVTRKTITHTEIGNLRVSTVFIGIDLGIRNDEPILFETMVFDEDGNSSLYGRYTTWDDAEKGHQLICDSLTKN